MRKNPTFANLVELSKTFQDEMACRKYLELIIWNGKRVCPHCGSEKSYAFPDGKRYKCASNTCYKQFTVTVGTFFQSTKVPLQKWFHALYLFSSHKKGISSHQLARDLSVTQKTGWFILNRLRGVFTEKGAPILRGVFEIDESFIGGLEKNKPQSKKAKALRQVEGYSAKANKTAVFGVMQRDGVVKNWVVDKQQKSTLIHLIKQRIEKGSTIFSDDYTGFRPLSKLGYKHESVKHYQSEFVRGNVHTGSLDSYWSGLKRGIIGIYHQVSKKHLHRYCNEFSYRFNTRKLSERERFDMAIRQCAGKLTYSELIADSMPTATRIESNNFGEVFNWGNTPKGKDMMKGYES